MEQPDSPQLKAELQELARTERLLANEVAVLESFVASSGEQRSNDKSGSVAAVDMPLSSSVDDVALVLNEEHAVVSAAPAATLTSITTDHPDMAAGPPVASPTHAAVVEALDDDQLEPLKAQEATTTSKAVAAKTLAILNPFLVDTSVSETAPAPDMVSLETKSSDDDPTTQSRTASKEESEDSSPSQATTVKKEKVNPFDAFKDDASSVGTGTTGIMSDWKDSVATPSTTSTTPHFEVGTKEALVDQTFVPTTLASPPPVVMSSVSTGVYTSTPNVQIDAKEEPQHLSLDATSNTPTITKDNLAALPATAARMASSSSGYEPSDVDVESIATADFLQVPLVPMRQRSGSEGDSPIVQPSSSGNIVSAATAAAATTTSIKSATLLARGSMDDVGIASSPAAQTNATSSKSTSPQHLLGFDPNTYSYDGDGVVVVPPTGNNGNTNSDTKGMDMHVPEPLPSFAEEESVAETVVSATAANHHLSPDALDHQAERPPPTSATTTNSIMADAGSNLSVVASSLMSSYSLPPNCSSADDDTCTEYDDSSPRNLGIARKPSYGDAMSSDDGDDDESEHTAALMMKLMASRSSAAMTYQSSIKADLTLTDSQVYMTESEEGLDENEGQVLRASLSDASGGTSSSGASSGSGTPRNTILSPAYASSDEGDYDHALDFFGDDNEDDSGRVTGLTRSGIAGGTAARSGASATTTSAGKQLAVAAAAAAAAAASSSPTATFLSSAQTGGDDDGFNVLHTKSSLSQAAYSNKMQPAAAAAAARSTDVPRPGSTLPPHETLDQDSEDDFGDKAVEPLRRERNKMKPCHRVCYWTLGLLFWVGVAFLMYLLVVWSRDGFGSSGTVASSSSTAAASPDKTPGTTSTNTTLAPSAAAAIDNVASTETPTTAPSVTRLSSSNSTPTVAAAQPSTTPPSAASTNRTSTNTPSLRGSQTQAPTPAPFDEDLFQLLVNVSADDGAALRNESTPQYQAFTWLSGNANLSSYLDDKRITRYVLATLYYSTGGNNSWLDNELWLTDADECDWWSRSRIRPCSPTGQIQELELSFNNLEGTLPSELGLLSDHLTLISIGGGPDTSLTGSLPFELGQLSLLEELRLPNNLLTGTLPQTMGAWVDIATIELSDNRLSGPLPFEVGLLSNAEVLSLENNLLGGPLPQSIGNLTKLTTLSLASNRFSLLPTNVGLLQKLETLSLEDNQFQGRLVSELSEMTSLRIVKLGSNELTGTIPELGLLAATVIDLSNNGLVGTLPSSLGGKATRSLLLFGNALSGAVPSELVRLNSLQTLEIQSNNFSGSMPTAICELYNQTLPTVFADCDEVICPCCDYCCKDGEGCVCRHLNTTNEWLCY